MDQPHKRENTEEEMKMPFDQKCAESEHNYMKSKGFADEFMSVREDYKTVQPNVRRSKQKHKKGNKSMNLRNEPGLGNQLAQMNMINDFDLKTLDLGDSDIKT
jgi:hypothetical protein